MLLHSYDIDLDEGFEKSIRKLFEKLPTQDAEAEANKEKQRIKDLCRHSFGQFRTLYGALPSVGDRIEFEKGKFVVIQLREFLFTTNEYGETKDMFILVREFRVK